MKIVISPAKSLDYSSKLPTSRGTQARFLDMTIKLNRKMQRVTKPKLKKLMDISQNLADLNYTRYKEFQEEHTHTNSRPAMYAFAGDVYTGLDAYTIPTGKIDELQEKLRILSGMYGILRPLDLIQPYRLEMGTQIGIERKKNLYDVWQKKVTDSLNKEMEDNELFINLASNEYFRVIDTKKLKVPVTTPIFKDFKNGDLKVISFFAKKARGAMVRYILDNDIKTIKDIKNFDYENYRFSNKYSENDNEPVFVR